MFGRARFNRRPFGGSADYPAAPVGEFRPWLAVRSSILGSGIY